MKIYNASSKDFVQIINVDNRHWVTCTNIGIPPGFVRVYDSAPAISRQSGDLKQQLAYMHGTEDFTMCFPDVQHQDGDSDCGPFAIAFAYLVCERRDPCSVTLDQSQLRNHIKKCIQDDFFSMFPTIYRENPLSRSVFLPSSYANLLRRGTVWKVLT